MYFLNSFKLMMFDFDGLLVNTEEIHFEAYRRTLADLSCTLPWDFHTYCSHAHYSSDALQRALKELFPNLFPFSDSWSAIYRRKTDHIKQLYRNGVVALMPDVANFLSQIDTLGIKKCVVTHSPDDLVNLVRGQHSVLNTFDRWITREHYDAPKPDPECYVKAMNLFAVDKDEAIGFEDTPRGMQALVGSGAAAVMIGNVPYPEISLFEKGGARHCRTFGELRLGAATLTSESW